MKDKVREFFHKILPAKMSSFEPRDVQIKMAESIAEAFNLGNKVIVEAGTGTGKSLAYLIPSLFTGKDSHVAISTGTKNLQEQLYKKDLPFLNHIWQDVYKQEISYMYVQGRSNYVCLTRLYNTLLPENEREILISWLEETETGNINELTGSLHQTTLRSVVSDPDYCLGQICPSKGECFIAKLRAKAYKTNILVVNHHLLLTDLMIKDSIGAEQNSILPSLTHIVLDEAHHLEEAATECFGHEVYFEALHGLRNQIINNRELKRQNIELQSQIERELWEAAPHINRAKELAKKSERDENHLEIDPDIIFAAENTKQYYKEAAENLLEYGENSQEAQALSRKLNRMVMGLEAFLDESEASISWANRDGFHNVPLKVSETLNKILFNSTEAIVLTSATLSTSGNFKYIRSRLGLTAEMNVTELILPSPFDYRKVLLATPTDLLNPNSDRDIERIACHLKEMLPKINGGSFILCTSFKMVNAIQETLQDLEGINLYVHGQRNAQELVSSFREDGQGVLIGVDSFWEGVDVPGDALKAVFITKLPFPVPTEPLYEARRKLVEDKGGNSFRELALPTALLKLRQGFGRLIRRQTDEGLVVIYDSRILFKSYSRDVFNSLPRCTEWRGKVNEMATFIKQNKYWKEKVFHDVF
ncbi:MAG: ATP-dependent DNA helicase [Firmicutes bacterium]|nr:ATP-dependent DNA helicase [Bacillota bacterium]